MTGCVQQNHFYIRMQTIVHDLFILKSNPDKSTKYYIFKYIMRMRIRKKSRRLFKEKQKKRFATHWIYLLTTVSV